jgi:hypothetical protein
MLNKDLVDFLGFRSFKNGKFCSRYGERAAGYEVCARLQHEFQF